jgi:type II secretory pathway component GspD/PulD (secretin)
MKNNMIRAAFLGLATTVPFSAMASGRITGISVSKIGTGMEVLIQGAGLSMPTASLAANGMSYDLDFECELAGQSEKLQIWQNGLQTIQTVAPAIGTKNTKLRFGFSVVMNVTVRKELDGYSILFEDGSMPAPAFEMVETKTSAQKFVTAATTKVAPKISKPMTTKPVIKPSTKDVKTQGTSSNPRYIKVANDTTRRVMRGDINSGTKSFPTSSAKGSSLIKVAGSEKFELLPLPESMRTESTRTDAARGSSSRSQTNYTAANKTTPGFSFATPFQPASNLRLDQKSKATGISAQPFVTSNSSGSKKAGQDPRVSLDFVNTEVVQILKSLALQTRVNIVTSPDVNGKLSVKLDNVNVKEALNLITSLVGLKFAQVGKTYVVTSQARFVETLRSVQGSKEDITLSRVIPIFSGQGNQIKVAVMKSVSLDSAYGRFELVLPSEKVSINVEKTDGGEKGPKEEAKVKTESNSVASDPYMMIIGAPGRLDEIEQLVTSIDKQLCKAMGIDMRDSNQTVTDTYFVHGARAKDLVEAIAGVGKSTIGSVELLSTPAGSISRQAVVLHGRADEVANVMFALTQLDSDQNSTSTEFKIVDLKYTDPRALREALIVNVPGLSVTIAPNGVLNLKTYQQDQIRNMSEQRGTDQPAPQGGGTALASGNQNALQPGAQGQAQGAQGGNQIKDNKSVDGTGFLRPWQDYEQFGIPMRLIMRGSKDQIDRALSLIGKYDTAPKQIALEMRVLEVSREELYNAGIDWNLFTSGAVKLIRLSNPNASQNNRIGVNISGRDVSGDVSATLDQLSTGNNLISRPNLICGDGQGNEVFVGDAIRYIESIISGQNGPSVTTGTVRTGVRLAVLPRIGADGTINIHGQASVVYLKGFKQVPQIGGELPQTSERNVNIGMTMKSGETFAIGGLVQDQDRKEISGLPFLKDLPVLGQFFRRTTIDKIKSELVIFVTAKEINPDNPDVANILPMQSKPSVSDSAMSPKAAMNLKVAKPSKKDSKATKAGGN